jgi:hypothetical protein
MRRHRSLAVIATCLILFAAQAQGQQPVHRVGVLTAIDVPENTHASDPRFEVREHTRGLAEAEVAAPSDEVWRQVFDQLR